MDTCILQGDSRVVVEPEHDAGVNNQYRSVFLIERRAAALSSLALMRVMMGYGLALYEPYASRHTGNPTSGTAECYTAAWRLMRVC